MVYGEHGVHSSTVSTAAYSTRTFSFFRPYLQAAAGLLSAVVVLEPLIAAFKNGPYPLLMLSPSTNSKCLACFGAEAIYKKKDEKEVAGSSGAPKADRVFAIFGAKEARLRASGIWVAYDLQLPPV